MTTSRKRKMGASHLSEEGADRPSKDFLFQEPTFLLLNEGTVHIGDILCGRL